MLRVINDEQAAVKERKDGIFKKVSTGVEAFLEELSKIGNFDLHTSGLIF